MLLLLLYACCPRLNNVMEHWADGQEVDKIRGLLDAVPQFKAGEHKLPYNITHPLVQNPVLKLINGTLCTQWLT